MLIKSCHHSIISFWQKQNCLEHTYGKTTSLQWERGKKKNIRETDDRKQGSYFSFPFPLPPIKHSSYSVLPLFSATLPTPLFSSPTTHTCASRHMPPTTFLLPLWLQQRSGWPPHQREGAPSVGAARTLHVGGLQSGPPPAIIRALYPARKRQRGELKKKNKTMKGGEDGCWTLRVHSSVWSSYCSQQYTCVP